MVALYVGGQKVEWADLETILAESGRIELRNDAGNVVGVVIPQPPPENGDPDWVKAITSEEIARRTAEPGYTFEEVKKRLGWE